MRVDSKSKPEDAEGSENRGSKWKVRFADNELTNKIIAAAIEVHRTLGPGLLESAYEECLCYELSQIDLRFERQVETPILYKGLRLDCRYRIDLLVEDSVVVELKSVEELMPIHSAQLLTYLKSTGRQVGLLINFNVPALRHGLKRVVNCYTGPSPVARTSAPSAAESETGHSAESGGEPFSHLSPRESPRLRASAVNGSPARRQERV